MAFLDWLTARDRRLAETRYADRESASDRAARLRRERHHQRLARDSQRNGQSQRRR
ncbi:MULTISPECIES: hypothetical protein [unclassified Streptomyces]|uniref:hypothetical protein n=1 Tax=unclassified Streptomyces TaxID=2593676 RepID=UPI00081E3574|nr:MULTISPECIES: hypothetical protein [unclassified Streptomyces]SCG06715.1 hypothetical protein GA0115259_110518 [Streptomyces sp. MnatMP-M17]